MLEDRESKCFAMACTTVPTEKQNSMLPPYCWLGRLKTVNRRFFFVGK
jgi:hypothetical protein